MKRNLPGIFALFFAAVFVTFSAFTVKSVDAETFTDARYIHFDLSGSDMDYTNYNSLASAPTSAPTSCPGAAIICWIRVVDVDQDGDVDADDFDATVRVLDSNNNGTLSDEAEIPGILEKRIS